MRPRTHRARSVHTPGPDGGLARWRRERLLRAGFDADLAAELAGDNAIDLHALIALAERGCPPQVAARILAPLDDRGNAC